MQLDLLIAITTRAKSKYEADKSWLEIYDDESWKLIVWTKVTKSVLGGHNLVANSGSSFEELPALLSSLKDFTESYPKES